MKKQGIIRRVVDAVVGKRRFEAAAIDRDSQEQFARVGYERPIDEDLAEDLPTMRARCRDAIRNNSLVEGVVNTHKADVIGPDGPSLDVQSDNEAYNREAEDFWREWAADCDYNRQLSFSDFLRQDIELAWSSGDSITQTLYDPQYPGAAKWRLLGISPDRLDTPYNQFGNPNVILGVEVVGSGRPIAYHISEPSRIGPYRQITGKYTRISASQIQHIYEAVEPGQVRGIPWLASSLRSLAHINSFDRETLEAARTAALFGVILETQPGVIEPGEFVRTTNKLTIPTRSAAYAAPGYTAKQLQAQHPNTRYVEFIHEQYRKLGRAVGMPLLTILLDARSHNYSSARYDGQVYRRHLNVIQSRLTRQRCNPCAYQVLLDAERIGAIRRRPQKIRLVWGWSQPPEVDEYKAAQADELEVRLGSKSLSQVCASRNRNFEEVVQARLRDDEYLQANGFPTVSEMLGNMESQNSQGGQASDTEEPAATPDRFYAGYSL